MTLNFYTKIKILFLNFMFFSKHASFYRFLLKKIKFSKSQVFQDLFVLYFLNCKKNGNFIEIGGGNGIDISNSYILEKKYKWSGTICEPNKTLQKKIIKSRSAKLIKEPVTEKCYKNMVFYENFDPYQSSTIKSSKVEKIIKMKSICLNHLMKKIYYKKSIDYISIDTEGNEYEILKNFNFRKFKVKILTIEHNFNNEKRQKIFKLMKRNNFERMFTNLSYMDDWYIRV